MLVVAVVTIVVSASIMRQGLARAEPTHSYLDQDVIPDAAVARSGLLHVVGGGLCSRQPIR